MPVIEPTNLQQVLQMSSAVEKVQAQQVQHLAADQIQNQERALLDEAKRTELQEPEGSDPTEPTHPDESGRGRRRLRFKKTGPNADEEGKGNLPPQGTLEESQGSNLDIVV
ncbi:MAG: hypothetical protein OEM27_03765 [Nitrospinota bacterium]|nr:hypothetical protein [Nitrospinota bacterium]